MNKQQFVFGKDNYIWLAVSIAVIIIGFILVSGGETTEEAGFDHSIFNARRLLIAPIVIMSGFGLVIYSIIKKSKTNL